MAGQVELIAAIANALRLDTGTGSLVELTGHNLSAAEKGIRIGRESPQAKERTPYLSILINQSRPMNENYVTFLQRSRVHLKASARDAVTTVSICDRLERLFNPELYGQPPNSFYDLSDENIQTKNTMYVWRDDYKLDDKTEIWEQMVVVDVLWVPVPCP